MAQTMVKDIAKLIIDKIPDNATWGDLMYEIYSRQAIEAGLDDSKAGRTKDVGEIREKYGPRVKVHWTGTAEEHLDAIYRFLPNHLLH